MKIVTDFFSRRFTKNQAEYIANNDFLNPRSKMSAGVVLEFITDTQKIGLYYI